MLHTMLPMQYSPRTGVRFAEPHRRSMTAVLRAVADDSRCGFVERIDTSDPA
jgi:hypothetical protein